MYSTCSRMGPARSRITWAVFAVRLNRAFGVNAVWGPRTPRSLHRYTHHPASTTIHIQNKSTDLEALCRACRGGGGSWSRELLGCFWYRLLAPVSHCSHTCVGIFAVRRTCFTETKASAAVAMGLESVATQLRYAKRRITCLCLPRVILSP